MSKRTHHAPAPEAIPCRPPAAEYLRPRLPDPAEDEFGRSTEESALAVARGSSKATKKKAAGRKKKKKKAGPRWDPRVMGLIERIVAAIELSDELAEEELLPEGTRRECGYSIGGSLEGALMELALPLFSRRA